MSEEAAAPAEAVSIPAHKAGGEGPISLGDAVRSYTDFKRKQDAGAQAESAEPATPEESEAAPAVEDAAPLEEATGETQDANPAEEPPLERPRSWSKEKEAIWAKLDRETQQYMLDHDSEVSKGVRNAQNEAAEKLKGLTAKEQQAEQVRQQYEQALPNLLQMLQETQQGEFSDIKTMADVEKLAREDWPRYALWDAQQKKIAAVSAEVRASQERQQSEFKRQWSEYASKQDQLLNERAPELADKTSAEKWTKAAQSLLEDIGFKPEELAHAWDGQASLSLRDHRTQLLVLKAAKYDESLKQQKVAKESVAKKALPPVQRPGAAKPANAGAQQQIQALQKQLGTASGINAARIGAQITKLQRQAAS